MIGDVHFYFKSNYNYYVWPVRSGQVEAIGSTEICDGIDNDLYGLIDEGFTDTDSDGQADCVDSDDDNDGYTDDAEITAGSDPLNPASTPEVCDGVDNDLDGQTDEGLTTTYYQDTDNDTYGNPSITTQACTQPTGYVTNNTDCNDSNASVNPIAAETCNNIDDNCNGLIDEGCPGVTDNTPPGSNVEIIPTPDVTLSFDTVATSGTTTVTSSGTGQPPPSGFKIGNPPIYYEITSTATFSGLVEVCINYDENQFATERSLKLFHLEGSWKDITTSLDTTANIICGNTTSFSPFIVAEQLSTAVTLSNLSATADGDNVLLTWSTKSEADNEGFVVLRGENPNGHFSPVSSMIPAVGGLGIKAAYTFTDSNVEEGKTYYYRLQDVDSRGVVTTHNVSPVTTVVAGVENPSQKIQDQKQDIQSIPQEIDQEISQEIKKKSSRDSVVEAEFPPTLILPRKGGGDNDTTDNAFPQGEGSLGEAAQSEKVIVPSVDHIGTASSNLAEGRQKQSPDNLENESSARNTASAPSSFSVTIEDEIGNLICISKMNNAPDSDASAIELDVKEDTGKVILTWQGLKPVKGFVIYRAEKGKKEYSPITSLIPYIGIGEKDVLQYRFIDNGVKPGVKYEYHIKVVDSSDSSGKKPV